MAIVYYKCGAEENMWVSREFKAEYFIHRTDIHGVDQRQKLPDWWTEDLFRSYDGHLSELFDKTDEEIKLVVLSWKMEDL